MAEEDCFAGFDHRALVSMVANYITYLKREHSHQRALLKVGRAFGHKPEVVDRIVNRLLPKFLLKVLVQKSGRLPSHEESITKSFLASFINNGCCKSEALADAAIEHSKHSYQIEPLVRQTLWKLISDLKPLPSRSLSVSAASAFA
jgi:hypothetical protein